MVSQIAIMILGASAIWFVSQKKEWKRWGYILGIASQPFWFYTAYTNEQWGIFIMCLFYTYSWGNGIWNYWIKPSVDWSDLEDSGLDNILVHWEEVKPSEKPIKIEDFHIGFEYEQYQLDSERYLNKGMIWVKKTYTMISPRLSKMQKLIEEGVIRKPQL